MARMQKGGQYRTERMGRTENYGQFTERQLARMKMMAKKQENGQD